MLKEIESNFKKEKTEQLPQPGAPLEPKKLQKRTSLGTIKQPEKEPSIPSDKAKIKEKPQMKQSTSLKNIRSSHIKASNVPKPNVGTSIDKKFSKLAKVPSDAVDLKHSQTHSHHQLHAHPTPPNTDRSPSEKLIKLDRPSSTVAALTSPRARARSEKFKRKDVKKIEKVERKKMKIHQKTVKKELKRRKTVERERHKERKSAVKISSSGSPVNLSGTNTPTKLPQHVIDTQPQFNQQIQYQLEAILADRRKKTDKS